MWPLLTKNKFNRQKVTLILIHKVLFTNPSARTGYDTRSIFKRSLTGLNTEFSFSKNNWIHTFPKGISAIWNAIKREFFQTVGVSMLLDHCTASKHIEKKLDGDYKRNLRTVLKKSRKKYPTKQDCKATCFQSHSYSNKTR